MGKIGWHVEVNKNPVLTPEGEKEREVDLELLMVVCGAMVFFLQYGLSTMSAGSIRRRNARNILFKHLLCACLGAIAFYLIGYGIAFGGGGEFMGIRHFALHNADRSIYSRWFFEYSYSIVATTIAMCALAERARFETHLLGTILMTSWVYPVVAHWVWSEKGWLSMVRPSYELFHDSGMIDFSGAGVVHMVGGFGGLAGVWIMGSRRGRFNPDGEVVEIPGNSSIVILLGVLSSWFAWYAVNAGRVLTLSDNIGILTEIGGVCAVNTTLSALFGGLISMLLARFTFSGVGYAVWDIVSTGNGVLAGLVSISAACAVVDPWAAIIIGVIGGCIYFWASQMIPQYFKVDDPCEVISIHAFCGAWGLLAAAAFADEDLVTTVYGKIEQTGESRPYGFIEGGGGRLLLATINGAASIWLWAVCHMIVFFVLVRLLHIHRVSPEKEATGWRTTKHATKRMDAGVHNEMLAEIKDLREELAKMRGDHLRF